MTLLRKITDQASQPHNLFRSIVTIENTGELVPVDHLRAGRGCHQSWNHARVRESIDRRGNQVPMATLHVPIQDRGHRNFATGW